MKLRVLLILAVTLLVLILVPTNGALLEWLGLNGSLFADSLSSEYIETPDSIGSITSTSKPAAPDDPDISLHSNKSPDGDVTRRTLVATGEDRGSERGAGDNLESHEWPEAVNGAGLYVGEQKTLSVDPATLQTEWQDGPERLSLEQNHPNPFNSTTTICFSIPFSGEATLEVLNILGQRVREIFNGHLDQGVFEITVDESIGDLASGIYFYRLTHEKRSLVRKMLLLR